MPAAGGGRRRGAQAPQIFDLSNLLLLQAADPACRGGAACAIILPLLEGVRGEKDG